MSPSDITIKELAERAQIHRKTFYLRYTCIEALFEDVIQDIANDYYQEIDQIPANMPSYNLCPSTLYTEGRPSGRSHNQYNRAGKYKCDADAASNRRSEGNHSPRNSDGVYIPAPARARRHYAPWVSGSGSRRQYAGTHPPWNSSRAWVPTT